MNGNSLSQALGLFACFGVLLLLVVIAVIARTAYGQRGSYNRRVLRPENPVVHTPPFEEDDFGGVPTTGPVQEFERDYHPEQIIGSSGFEGQGEPDNNNDEDQR